MSKNNNRKTEEENNRKSKLNSNDIFERILINLNNHNSI